MNKKGLWVFGIVLLGMMLLFTACAKGGTAEPATGNTEENVATTAESESEEKAEETEAPADPTATPEPTFPDRLVLHPDAFDIEISPASNTYIYYVPAMVKETLEYLETELKAKGWETLGKPVLMGHLGTLNFKMGGDRLSVSLQDNEISLTTRVQMLLLLAP